MVAGLVAAGCSNTDNATAEVRICRGIKALFKEGPVRTGTPADDPVLQSIRRAGGPSDPRFAVIQQDAVSRGTSPSDTVYLYDHCGQLGVVLDRIVVWLPMKAGVTREQLDAYLASPDAYQALLGAGVNDQEQDRVVRLYLSTSWNASQRAQAVSAVERSGLVGAPQRAAPTSTTP